MANDATTVLNDLSDISSNFTKYVVSPLAAFGIGGFVFDVEGDTTVNLTSEITDHYTEENTPIQDHISVKPKKVTLRNYVGELVYYRDQQSTTQIQNLAQKLTIIGGFLQSLTAAATQAKNLFEASNANSLDIGAVTSQAANLWSLVKNIIPPTQKQAQAYMYFKALQEQKILMSVQTPYEFMSSMAIESVIANQSEESKYVSSFSITLKQIRTVEVQSVPFNAADYQGRVAQQSQLTTQNGTMPGQDPSLTPPGVVQPPADIEAFVKEWPMLPALSTPPPLPP